MWRKFKKQNFLRYYEVTENVCENSENENQKEHRKSSKSIRNENISKVYFWGQGKCACVACMFVWLCALQWK